MRKADPIANAFVQEFTQIFRQDDDQGSARLKNTPDKEQLEKNLNSLIEHWVNVPNNPLGNLQTAKEIENLCLHIQKGCLSGLPPGCGTERNEQLHRLLNRSLITGATTLSTELAIALLTILLYYHSNKSSAFQHKCNSRVVPVVPINGIDNLREDDIRQAQLEVVREAEKSLTGDTPGESSLKQTLNPEVIVAEEISELCTDYVAGSIITVAFNLKEVMDDVDAQSYNRAFDSSSVLHLSKFSNLLSLDDAMEINDPNINTHLEDLQRNLAGFRLEIESISKDGDWRFVAL